MIAKLLPLNLHPARAWDSLRATLQATNWSSRQAGSNLPSFSSFSALTDALIIDLGHLNYVTVSPDRSSAKVGAGIRLGALYITLNAYSTTFVGGICPTVGLSGLVGAGGFNMQMRALGVSSDHVLAAKVVTADGKTLIASPSSNPDLFW